jgi:cysteine synthase
MGRTLSKATSAVTFCQEGAPVDDARIATTDGLAAYNDEKTGRRNVQHQIAEFQALERELSELILTTDAVARAKQLVREIPGSIMLDQFSNPANPKIHRRMTVLEIWDDTGGAVDVFISAVGTGGTITGVGEVLKERKPAVRVIAIEPAGAAVLSGGPAGKHLMPGIGVGFTPRC